MHASLVAVDAPILAQSIADLLARRARLTPDRPMLLASDQREPLTCAGLLARTRALAATLNDFGLGRGDRIAIHLPPGAELAALLLGITCVATAAPLNPRARQDELQHALEDFGVRAVVVEQGVASAGRAAATALNLPILELSCLPDAPAGAFRLNCTQPLPYARPRLGAPRPDEVACVIHTSGTTARPKIVPLTQNNLCAAAFHHAQAYRLTPADRCLHIAQAFHVMGITTLLTGVVCGSAVICAPGFQLEHCLDWLSELRPTWYAAAPAVHQSLLRRAAVEPGAIAGHCLRLLRSGAAPISGALFDELEQFWGAAVANSYGMSECPVIATNHAPPGPRKAGSVGLPCGVEIVLLDERGQPLPPGLPGEIAVRGPALMPGYEDRSQAGADALGEGFFRTGDLGYFDAEGFLFLTGRRKEMINRGGSKIAPCEVDEVMLSHAAVADALTFAWPDERLGEEVAVAAVLKPQARVTELELRQHAAQHLAEHKVPRRVVFLETIPTGLTGKPQRIGLAERLGLGPLAAGAPVYPAAHLPPGNPLEQLLADLWEQNLGLPGPIGADAHFMHLGGDSLQAVSLFSHIRRLFGRELPLATLMAAPTVAQLARAIVEQGLLTCHSCLVPIQPGGSCPPLFCLPGVHGHVFTFYPLARQLGDDQPLYGLQLPDVYDPATPPQSIEQLAAFFLEKVRTVQPHGPYRLAGYSFGGRVALEMAGQLCRERQEVSLVALFDSYGPGYPRPGSIARQLVYHGRRWMGLPRSQRGAYLRQRVCSLLQRLSPPDSADAPAAMPQPRALCALRGHRPAVYPGRVVLFRAQQQPAHFDACVPDPSQGWRTFAPDLRIHTVPGDHETLFAPAHLPFLAEALRPYLLAVPAVMG